MRKRTLWALAAFGALLALATPAKADFIDATIPDIQDTSSTLNDTLVANVDTVRVTGVVTGADEEGSGFGFYIEDGSFTDHRGILVFTGGTNVFADSGLSRGDRVRVTGTVTEFQGGTEIISPSGSAFGSPPPIVEVLGTDPVPGPTLVTPADVAINGLVSEQFEGMFLKFSVDIRVGSEGSTDPRIPFFNFLGVEDAGPSLDTTLVNLNALAEPNISPPPNGTVISFLQGILDQRSLGYNYQVRDGNDILLPTPPNLVNAFALTNDTIRVVFDKPLLQSSAENVNNYSRATFKAIDSAILQTDNQSIHLVTSAEPQVPGELETLTAQDIESLGGGVMPSPQDDTFRAGVLSLAEIQEPEAGKKYSGPAGTDTTQYLNETVTTRGTVVARIGSLVWLQDSAGGLRSGIKIFAPSGPMARGDDITVVGTPIEFFDETEFSGTQFERNHGAGVLPSPIVPATLAELNDSAGPPAAEDYEHVLVQVNDVAVSNENAGFGEFVVKPGSEFTNEASPETVHVDDRARQIGNVTYFATNGDQFTSITGAFEISFGNSKLEPRDDNDLVMGPVVSVDDRFAGFALRTPAPNPVSFSRGPATFAFTLPRAGEASLSLYDLRGRRVARLAGGRTLEAGEHVVTWNGRSAGGARVGAGIYFAQLRLGNLVATGKVTVAE